MYDAAEYSHLAIVKWLYVNWPKSHTCRSVDRAIRSGHFQVACWLQERFRNYKIGSQLELHKPLADARGSWDSGHAFEMLLRLHVRYS
ncbi:hypothetical protein GQ600_6606 [Phytophthora cactorum]|nr:hypothetical protein GQ600_6606 [Phytophthora cactorum]